MKLFDMLMSLLDEQAVSSEPVDRGIDPHFYFCFFCP